MSKNEYFIKNNFKKNGYFLIRNIINKDLTKFLFSYLILKKQVFTTFRSLKRISEFNEDWGAEKDTMVPSYSTYGDIAMDNLLQTIKNKIEKKLKLKIYESYSYARIYKKGDFLKKHIDRNSCEISVTLNLGGDVWPIYLIDKNNIKIKAILKPGNALIYKGTELMHWREPFKKNKCVQVFLHYTLKNNNLYDNRLHLGLPFKKYD